LDKLFDDVLRLGR